MALISDRDREVVRERLEAGLEGDVEIVMFTERTSPIIIPGRSTCETCDQTVELLSEVADLSEKLTLTVHEISEAKEEAAALGIDRVPAFVAKGAARGGVRFFGIPSGYEFSAFLDDLIDTSRGSTGLSQETRDFLASLKENVNIKVFTTPT
jgi:alkyl hydroperoxide reductase subunit AhpF